MAIKHAILGFLSWTPQTGYDLKKFFVDSETFYWSGNNNQIYRALVQLHKEGLVTREIEYQDDAPPRKIYTVTEKGMAVLRDWVLTPPELPQVKHPFLMQLAWAEQLEAAELDDLLVDYEDEVRVKRLMLETQAERNNDSPARSARESYLWRMITENWLAYYQHELEWVRQVRRGIEEMEG